MDFEIILQLGLITSSLSIILCRHKGKVIATNIDGLEWKRAKWSPFIQNITKRLERYGIKNSDYLIADNIGIQEYIKNEYNRHSEFIPYGALKPTKNNQDILDFYKMKPNSYYLSIARLEPENNLEMMFDAYLLSGSNFPYFVIGKHPTIYGDFLKDKYRNKGIIFLGAIYDKEVLDNIRYYSKLYIHGHSVGGTNPSLLEAMAAKALIVSHDNKFNRSVLNKNAFYFKNLGHRYFKSVLKICDAIIGNSSSGVIEVPYLGIPTINIGLRQTGRKRTTSIIDCKGEREKILNAIYKSQNTKFKFKYITKRSKKFLYKKNSSKKIFKKILALLRTNIQPKEFVDIIK